MRSPMLCAVPLLLSAAISLAQAQPDAPAKVPSPEASQGQASAVPVASSRADKPGQSAETPPQKSEKDGSEKRKLHFQLGGVTVGAGYSHVSGPFYPYTFPYAYGPYGFYPGDWYSASLWYPFWSPDPFYRPGYFAHNNGRGELRLSADPKDARVYIDGGYAGTADRLKDMWLDPGAYDLTLSAAGHEDFHQRLYVLSGKSLRIAAKLNTATVKEKP